jgi:hypothetical protein
VYFLIYVSIITVYFFLVSLFFTWNLALWHIGGIILGLSVLLIAINLHSDIGNFRAFLLEIENVFKNLHEAEKVDTPKTA